MNVIHESCLRIVAATFLFAAYCGRGPRRYIRFPQETYGGNSKQWREHRTEKSPCLPSSGSGRGQRKVLLPKRGRGFLWRYTAPKEKVFLYDGADLGQTRRDKPVVVKEKANKGKMEGSFLDLVDDVTRIDKLFTVKESTRQIWTCCSSSRRRRVRCRSVRI